MHYVMELHPHLGLLVGTENVHCIFTMYLEFKQHSFTAGKYLDHVYHTLITFIFLATLLYQCIQISALLFNFLYETTKFFSKFHVALLHGSYSPLYADTVTRVYEKTRLFIPCTLV